MLRNLGGILTIAETAFRIGRTVDTVRRFISEAGRARSGPVKQIIEDADVRVTEDS